MKKKIVHVLKISLSIVKASIFISFTLWQDAIYRIKVAFNKEFDDVFKQKEAEIKRVSEKNDRIRKILGDLELVEKVFTPVMSVDEKPELLLEVKDDEVPFEKYISPEEQAKLEEQARIDEGLLQVIHAGLQAEASSPFKDIVGSLARATCKRRNENDGLCYSLKPSLAGHFHAT